MKVFLPNGLRLSGSLSGDAYLSSNAIDYIIIGIKCDKKSKKVEIPLYVSSIGDYVINPVVIKVDDKYHLSNEISLSIE